jgi:hypothetical protein
MGRGSKGKQAPASKAGTAKPSAAQVQEQDAKHDAHVPQKRKRAPKAAAAQQFDDDSDPELLEDLEDGEWDPTAADSELADDILGGLYDESEDSQEESDQEADAHQQRREPKASAR